MTAHKATGSTGSNRVRAGSKTQQEPTGSTGSTGLLEDPGTRDPVPAARDRRPGPWTQSHRPANPDVRRSPHQPPKGDKP